MEEFSIRPYDSDGFGRDAMAQYKQVVANTFFDEPTETETDETDNGTD